LGPIPQYPARRPLCLNPAVITPSALLATDVATLQAALLAEQAARRAAVQANPPPDGTRPPPSRRKPVRAPLPAHLPRERVLVPGPASCPCCQGRLSKLGEDVTETLEVIPRQFKVIQTVRERFACRACEAIHQPPAPFHVITRGRAGPELLATILEAKFG
jgi:transposase